MNPGKIPVRQWQELYRAGAFASDDDDTRELASWTDFCDPLNDRRVQSLAKLVLRITHPVLLDNYRVYFVEHHPIEGPPFGSVCFDPITGSWIERVFSIDLDNPHRQGKWSLHTQRYGEGEPEFQCGNVHGMIRYIQVMATEIEQGLKPPFWEEIEAVRHLIFCVGGYYLGGLRREGEHSYSFWHYKTNSTKIAHATQNPEDIPPGTPAENIVHINGLYVFCQENIEKAVKAPDKSKRNPQKKKKEAER